MRPVYQGSDSGLVVEELTWHEYLALCGLEPLDPTYAEPAVITERETKQ